MLQVEQSAILLTFIKLPIVIKIFVLSIFESLFYTGFNSHLYKGLLIVNGYVQFYVSYKSFPVFMKGYFEFYISYTDVSFIKEGYV